MRAIAFVLSGTSAAFSGYGVLSGFIPLHDLEWHQSVIVAALWLGWAVPAVVLLYEECRR